MISKRLSEKVTALLTTIEKVGMVGLVADNHAFQTLNRIMETGTSLPAGVEEDQQDTEACAECFANPGLWGISDHAWKEFVSSWLQA